MNRHTSLRMSSLKTATSAANVGSKIHDRNVTPMSATLALNGMALPA